MIQILFYFLLISTMAFGVFISTELPHVVYGIIRDDAQIASGVVMIIFYFLCKHLYKPKKISAKNPNPPTMKQVVDRLTTQSSKTDKVLSACYLGQQLFLGVTVGCGFLNLFLR